LVCCPAQESLNEKFIFQAIGSDCGLVEEGFETNEKYIKGLLQILGKL
jgi:hypothetical protein